MTTMREYYGPFPFWLWNGRMEEAEIRRELQELREQRVTEAMIMPTSGLEPAYLSKEYFALVAYAVAQAKRLGMGIWLYDEYNWPSGAAGGLLLQRHPQYRMRFLRCYVRVVAADEPRELPLTIEEGDVVAATLTAGGATRDLRAEVDAWPRRDATVAAEYWKTRVEAQASYRDGRLELPAGECVVLIAVATIYRGLHAYAIGSRWSNDLPAYPDTLDPEAMRVFMKMTHEGYRKAIGRHFGSVVRGIFTDEPSLMKAHGAPAGWTRCRDLPWTAALPELFRRSAGYELTEALPALAVDTGTGDDSVRMRRDYRRVATARYLEAYHHPMRDWCAEHGIAYAGHVLSDKTAAGWVAMQGDYPEVIRSMHVPAMDYCFTPPTLGVERGYGWSTSEFITAKVIASVARHEGRRRVCSETFALCQYPSTLQDYKTTTAFLGAFGVNMMLVSATPSSLGVNRRRLVPTAHSPHSPFWPHYHRYADFVARLSRWLATARRSTSCALLYPVSDWHGVPDANDKGWRLARLVSQLHQRQVDFDFLRERQVLDATIAKGRFAVGPHAYATLIVPPTDALDARVAARIAELEAASVRVVRLTARTEAALPELPRPVRVDFPPEIAARVVVGELRRGKDPAYLVASFNDRESSGAITVTGARRPRLVDLETGRAGAIACQRVDGGWRIPLTLHPHQTLALQMDGRAGGSPQRLDRRFQASAALTGSWEVELGRRNASWLRSWSIQAGTEWKPVAPERLLLDHVGEQRVRAEFDLQTRCDDLALAFESEVISDLTLNGRRLRGAGRGRYFDRTTLEVAIARFAEPGINVVEAALRVPEHQRRNDSYGKTALTPIFALGGFAARDGLLTAAPERLELGDWCAQGLGNYSGTVTYRVEVDGGSLARRKELWLRADAFNGVVALRINGRAAGVRCWAPYLLEIGRHLKPGRNRIELMVTNTIANLLEKPAPSGLRGAAIGTLG
jgi:hypothetical protein